MYSLPSQQQQEDTTEEEEQERKKINIQNQKIKKIKYCVHLSTSIKPYAPEAPILLPEYPSSSMSIPRKRQLVHLTPYPLPRSPHHLFLRRTLPRLLGVEKDKVHDFRACEVHRDQLRDKLPFFLFFLLFFLSMYVCLFVHLIFYFIFI